MCKRLIGNEIGLVGYYRFDHTNGSTLTDLSKYGNHGTLMNMSDSDWITSGAAIGDDSVYEYICHAIQFVDPDDHVMIPNDSDFEKSTLTFEFWARIDWTAGSMG